MLNDCTIVEHDDTWNPWDSNHSYDEFKEGTNQLLCDTVFTKKQIIQEPK
jgi:hypothetical protein